MTRLLLLASAAVAVAGLPLAAMAAPDVVVDLPPIGALVAQVMQGTGAAPVVLLASGGDGHHHQLRPSEARAVAGADLLIWTGPQMAPWLDAAADALAPGQGVALLAAPGTHLHAGEDHDREHGDGDEHGDEDDHDEDGHDHHDHGGIDPHAWLDPANARLWLDVIAEALAAQDPDNAAAYRANAVEGRAAIDAAVAEARAILQGHDTPFIVSHDALGYYTEAMGLPPALALADLSDNAPSVGTLQRLRRQIAASGATCAHPEAGKDARAFSSLDGLGVQAGAPLDILGTTQGGAVSYPLLLTDLARAIADCPAP